MDTDKPLAGAVSIARELLESKGIQMPSFPHIYDECACADCEFYRTDVENAAREIARYSGMAELVEAVEAWAVLREKAFKMLEGPVSQMDSAESVKIRFDAAAAADRIVAAARRVRKGDGET